MPRIRTYKPEFFTSEDVSVLPFRARLTWLGLWTHCDDHGRTKDNVKLIKAAVWPLDDVSLRDVEEDLATLAGHGRIVRYEAGGVRLLAVVNWHFHQTINRPGKPKFPPPSVSMPAPASDETGHCARCYAEFMAHEGLTEDSVNSHGLLSDGSRQEGKGTGKGKEGTRVRARCPRHTDLPQDDPGPNCVACRDARVAGEAEASAQKQLGAERRAEENRQQAAARALAVAACSMCDSNGYIGGRTCDHDPEQVEVNANGVAKAWAVLGGRPHSEGGSDD